MRKEIHSLLTKGMFLIQVRAKKKKKKIVFVIAIYQAQNITSALPFYGKNEWKPSNTENPDGTHFLPL